MKKKCASCGRVNRVPLEHLADRGKCGACKSPLPPVSRPIDVDTKTFDAIISGARVPVLVDFWAAWCGPCRMAAPVVAEVARETAGKALVLKVDTEKHGELAARYDVRGIPHFIVFDSGQIKRQQAGLVGKREMTGWLVAGAPAG